MKKFFDIFIKELRLIIRDEGLIIFFFLLPVAYPIIYSWIYNNEVLHKVPVVVVDNDNSSESREFLRRCDAAPGIDVAYRAGSINEGRDYIVQQKANGIIYIPDGFARNIHTLTKATVSVYCDMTLLMAYKDIYQTCMYVSQDMGKDIQMNVVSAASDRQKEVLTKPLDYEEVPIFNTTGGYGNFIIPGVLVLIVQQVLLLAAGMVAGTRREKRLAGLATPPSEPIGLCGANLRLWGRVMAYFVIGSVVSCYMMLLVPRFFSFVSIQYPQDFFLFLIPYLLACIFFAIAATSFIRQREDVMVIVVFTSIMLLFMAGVSWPVSSIPDGWEYFSYLFPSTFGIRSFIALNTMGARIEDVRPYILCLWVQAAVYFCLSLFIYYRGYRSFSSKEEEKKGEKARN